MKDESQEAEASLEVGVPQCEISTVDREKRADSNAAATTATMSVPPPPEQAQFANDGFLLLPSSLPVEMIEEWAHQWATDAFFVNVFQNLHHLGHTSFPTHRDTDTGQYAMGRGIPHGFAEIVMRSPGRYEIVVEAAGSVLPVLETAFPFLPSLFSDASSPSYSWNDIRCVSTTVVIATPGATDQPWHADGGHVVLDHHAPCHCLTVCVPLTSTHYGPTQVRPGSHYWTRGNQLAQAVLLATARKQVRPCVNATMELGDVLVFDYRLLHRGRANTSSTEQLRVVLMVTLAVPWFRDVLNFPRKSMYD